VIAPEDVKLLMQVIHREATEAERRRSNRFWTVIGYDLSSPTRYDPVFAEWIEAESTEEARHLVEARREEYQPVICGIVAGKVEVF